MSFSDIVDFRIEEAVLFQLNQFNNFFSLKRSVKFFWGVLSDFTRVLHKRRIEMMQI